MELQDIDLTKFATDKIHTHNYMQYYEKHLPEKVNKLLEIGYFKGESLRMWHEIYPDAELHTVDLFEEYPQPDISWLISHKGNQSDIKLMSWLANYNFDIVIDDGSHNPQDQIASFLALHPRYKLYVIEDLHSNKDEFYRNGMDFNDTILGQIKNKKFPYPHKLYDDKIVFIFNK